MKELISVPKKEELTERGFNKNLQIHDQQTEDSLLKHGFTNRVPGSLYFMRMIDDNISFNLIVDAKTLSIRDIDVLDERFLQTFDYQERIINGVRDKHTLHVFNEVNSLLQTLQDKGVLTGFEKGMYV